MKSAIAKLLALSALLALMGATAPGTKIVSCKDANGHTVLADPSDPRCFKPPKTPDEIAAEEKAWQLAIEEYQKCKAAERGDQTLLSRYPKQAVHDAARRQALAEIDASLQRSQARLEQALVEHKRLALEAEFYPNGNLPAKLKRDIDANNALVDAQQTAIASQRASAAQKNAFYDDELARLKKLWSPPAGGRRRCVYPQR